MRIFKKLIFACANEIDFSQTIVNISFPKMRVFKNLIFACANEIEFAQTIRNISLRNNRPPPPRHPPTGPAFKRVVTRRRRPYADPPFVKATGGAAFPGFFRPAQPP